MAETRVSVRLAALGGRQVRIKLEGVGEAGSRGFGRLSREMEAANVRLTGSSRRVHVAAVAAAGVAMVRSGLSRVDAQAKLAQSHGTTVASIQTPERADELAGASMSGIEEVIKDLTRRLSQRAIARDLPDHRHRGDGGHRAGSRPAVSGVVIVGAVRNRDRRRLHRPRNSGRPRRDGPGGDGAGGRAACPRPGRCPETSARVEQSLRDLGATLRTGFAGQGARCEGARVTAVLGPKGERAADLFLVGIGAAADPALARAAGIACAAGILTESHLRARVPHVGAIGADRRLVRADAARLAVFHLRGGHLVSGETLARPADHMIARQLIDSGRTPPDPILPEGADALKAWLAQG